MNLTHKLLKDFLKENKLTLFSRSYSDVYRTKNGITHRRKYLISYPSKEVLNKLEEYLNTISDAYSKIDYRFKLTLNSNNLQLVTFYNSKE